VTTQAIPDIESDHKTWLREIESWQNHAPHWIREQSLMAAEYEQALISAREQGDRLREFERSVQSLCDAVMNAERQMAAERRQSTPSVELLKLHADCARQHDRLRELHMHLTHTQRSLLAGLASLKHEPARNA
jgi:hypothetical protein